MKDLLSLLLAEIDKSSADVAAEGAILNEMLEIVAKRAALRPTDTMVGSDGGGGFDVSEEGCSSTSTSSSLHPVYLMHEGEGEYNAEEEGHLCSLLSRWHWKRSLIICSSSMGALIAVIVFVVALLYPALVLECLHND